MLNKDVYLINPLERKLVNEGVASVNDRNLNVLRYEVETFVCDGQYEKGMEHILEVYLRNLGHEQQPAVWVSGFFGSGKSHLVKMLGAFWQDVEFQDGARARSLADLPDSIKVLLHELSTQAKRYGGLHAAMGTLSAGASGSIRLALLRIIYKSAGLPENYANASFVMWLKSEKIYDQVKEKVEAKGYDWNEELDNLYVAEGLHESLSEVKPNLFPTPESCVETLNNRFPNKSDVTSDEMIKSIKDALSKGGQMPLTLVVLDEVEQYIGDSTQRAMDVQEVVEACSKQIGSKLLFIGTGQTAVTGTALLKKLEGRFTVRIELSDTDVDAVVRKVILAKKPDKVQEIRKIMEKNIGEISRHLTATSIGHNQRDVEYFTQDYPILPVRRRFWENTLRVLDQTGTDSQLRNQLSMVHKATQSNINEPLGNVIPADYLYYDLADKMLHARVLPRKVHEKTMLWYTQGDDERLVSRACGLIFLINKLAGTNNEIGIKSNIDTLADLMVTDLSSGSSQLRSRLGDLLDDCELLMKVDDEYRIQTEENLAWLDDYASNQNVLRNEMHRVNAEREDRIKKKFVETVGKSTIMHGQSKVVRDINFFFGTTLPADANKNVYVWVRNEWSTDEHSVRIDARQAGNQSPTIFVFIPKRAEIANYLVESKASTATLSKKGSPAPVTPEGKEAMAAMETIKNNAERNIDELLREALSEAKVFQAGGNEIIEANLKDAISSAAKNSIHRLFQEFDIADNPNWNKVFSKAKEGAPDSLKYVGFNGDVSEHAVCKKVMNYIGSGKKGTDIRREFENAPYGWSGDAIDGSLLALMVVGLIRCLDESGNIVNPKDIERKQIGKMTFKIESVTISTIQRIQIRKLYQKAGIKADAGNESLKAEDFINYMLELAEDAGGVEPRPEKPDTSLINELKYQTGNEQLLSIYENRNKLETLIEEWSKLKLNIESRIINWNKLEQMISLVSNEDAISDIKKQVQSIKEERQLLHEPDMIVPLLKSLENILRTTINEKYSKYSSVYDYLNKKLNSNEAWSRLSEEKRTSILKQSGLSKIQPIALGTYEELLSALRQYPLRSWTDKEAALQAKFNMATEMAAKELEPKLQMVEIPKRTLKSEEEINRWIEEIRVQLKEKLVDGPIIVR